MGKLEYIFVFQSKQNEIHEKNIIISQDKIKIEGKTKLIVKNYFYFKSLEKEKHFSSGKIQIYNKSNKKLGEGIIVLIFNSKILPFEQKKMKAALKKLNKSNEKERMDILLDMAGKAGLNKEILNLNFKIKTIKQLIKQLELDTEIIILSFSNLFIIKRKYLKDLEKKMFSYIRRNEKKSGIKFGINIEELKNKIKIKNNRIFSFIYQKLIYDKKVVCYSKRVFLKKDSILTDEEKKIMKKLEDLYSKEKFSPLDIKGLAKHLGIDKRLASKYLDILIEKEKIIPTRGGFFVYRDYLDFIIKELRKLKVHKPRFRIKDFKQITKLSRKYNIPLLELLDFLEITRRVGDEREIMV